MQSSHHSVVIVGGGIAGLTAAYRIHRAGIAFRLLEARQRLGGRILSTDETGRAFHGEFDLGPSWFWPDMQPPFGRLVDELGLGSFVQQSSGDVLFHRAAAELPQRFGGTTQAPPSMRLVGGTASIVSALAVSIPKESIVLGVRARGVKLDGNEVELTFLDPQGIEQRYRSSQIVFALPPRLLEQSVVFTPRLDDATVRRWRNTPTWMAPHAKFLAIYDRAFWLENGLSGTAQSIVGPLAEIHDATTATGRAALFGFLGVSAEDRASIGEKTIAASCVRQLIALFGPEAAKPRATLFKDWAADPLAATEMDRVTTGHLIVDRRPWVGDDWRDHILLAGSETSISDPGYLAGAVEAAERATVTVIERIFSRARTKTNLPVRPTSRVTT